MIGYHASLTHSVYVDMDSSNSLTFGDYQFEVHHAVSTTNDALPSSTTPFLGPGSETGVYRYTGFYFDGSDFPSPWEFVATPSVSTVSTGSGDILTFDIDVSGSALSEIDDTYPISASTYMSCAFSLSGGGGWILTATVIQLSTLYPT